MHSICTVHSMHAYIGVYMYTHIRVCTRLKVRASLCNNKGRGLSGLCFSLVCILVCVCMCTSVYACILCTVHMLCMHALYHTLCTVGGRVCSSYIMHVCMHVCVCCMYAMCAYVYAFISSRFSSVLDIASVGSHTVNTQTEARGGPTSQGLQALYPGEKGQRKRYISICVIHSHYRYHNTSSLPQPIITTMIKN